jgi:hypothetical protein
MIAWENAAKVLPRKLLDFYAKNNYLKGLKQSQRVEK